jgi:uncharacterized protein (TIGR02118 family)
MIKAIALIKRKDGLSREEFAEHYEEVHAPLILSLMPALRRYVRNHVLETPGTGESPFDCITEFWVDSSEDGTQSLAFWESEAGRVIRDDETKFIDTSKTVISLVNERISEIDIHRHSE